MLQKMKFKFVLLGLYLLIRIAARRSKSFRAKLLEKNTVLVMKTKDEAVAVTLRCHQGNVRFQNGASADAVSTVIWKSAATGAGVMLKTARGDAKALVQAVISKDLVPQGNAGGVKWLLEVLKMLSEIY